MGEGDLHWSGWVRDRVASKVKDSAVNWDWVSCIKGIHLMACVIEFGVDCSIDSDLLSLREELCVSHGLCFLTCGCCRHQKSDLSWICFLADRVELGGCQEPIDCRKVTGEGKYLHCFSVFES